MNRLVSEKSPYLLQHSMNPIDWYPWGEDAFREARRRDVPVFLSIGYSTCHWCHVMAHESFEDEETAYALNQAFVCIKVDREERPDIDAIYMKVCQMLTGGGGWPLTIVMTSEKEPFFAGTYLPKKSRSGMLGVDELVKRVSNLWAKDRFRLVTEAAQNFDALFTLQIEKTGRSLRGKNVEDAFNQLLESHDWVDGGFGRAPKFPSPHNLMFLLRYWSRTREASALNMVTNTLQKMAKGGIRDHLGGGFHRYSIDAKWTIPHFEKMLYDQAILTLAYIEAFQATGDPFYADIAKEIADYVRKQLTSPEGGFFSAEDADSEGEEGRFYIWTKDEFNAILEPAELEASLLTYNISQNGNFENRSRTNIITSVESPEKIIEKLGISQTEYFERIIEAKKKLFAVREKRTRPLLDDKILTDWNGLIIASFARLGSILGDKKYVDAAIDAARFIKTKMWTDTLYHRYRLGEKSIPAFLDDYACLAWGFIELYESTYDADYLSWARELVDDAKLLFWDSDQGGFNINRKSEDSLLLIKEFYDGAKPSGNSIMAMNMIRLGSIYGEDYRETAEKLFQNPSLDVESNPAAYSYLLSAYTYLLGPSYEVVVVGEQNKSEEILSEIRRRFLPNMLSFVKDEKLEKILDYTSDMRDFDGIPSIYICSNRSCSLPISNVATAIKKLEEGPIGSRT